MSEKKASEIVDQEEGLRLKPYDDATGQTLKKGYTIVGSVAIAHGRDLLTKGISPAEAEYLKLNDLGDAGGTFADQELGWFARLDDVRQDVVTLMVFQLGARGFRAFKGLIDAIIDHDFNRAALEMLDSEWAKQTPKRARRMAEMMRTGRYA